MDKLASLVAPLTLAAAVTLGSTAKAETPEKKTIVAAVQTDVSNGVKKKDGRKKG